jgi:tRNA-specific 2-thiouridylase
LKTVVVGLSGGVDSSVTAYLLKEQGYNVVGMFMRNWNDESVTINNECAWVDDSRDALLTAEHLGIPFQTVDFSVQYKERIVNYMFAEYEAGRTPNPDVLCNREIKFDLFLEAAMSIGADYVATGHYVRKITNESGHFLASGLDENKDQSYFLCQVKEKQIEKALFPLGELQKSEVREIAEKANLPTAKKKDSQGLCFIGKVSLPDFLQQQLKPKIGKVVLINENSELYSSNQEESLKTNCARMNYHLKDGQVVGEHQGVHNYTIGQRRGVNIGGMAKPLFVIGIDAINNILFVGMGSDHPGLWSRGLFVDAEDVHWINNTSAVRVGESKVVEARTRYRQPLKPATLHIKNEGAYLIFDEPTSAIAPGQFTAWYENGIMLGSGVISQ